MRLFHSLQTSFAAAFTRRLTCDGDQFAIAKFLLRLVNRISVVNWSSVTGMQILRFCLIASER